MTKNLYFSTILSIFVGLGTLLGQEESAVEEATVEEAVNEEEGNEEEELLEYVEEAPSSPLSGFSIGLASTPGIVAGESFSEVPIGGSVVLTTPFGFKLGEGLRFTLSIAFGSYSGTYESPDGGSDDFNPSIIGLGGNLTLAKLIFVEGHAGNIGAGTGLRGFAGISLERLMKKSLGLPVNILVGGEGFYTSKVSEIGNASGWGGIGIRLDYAF